MTGAVAAETRLETLADLVDRLGGVPLERIRLRPRCGTATVQDVLDVRAKEGRICELIEGVLVEKAMGYMESWLAMHLGRFLSAYVSENDPGIVTGMDGTMQLMPDLVRIPDVAFTSWDRHPHQRPPTNPVPEVAPNLAVEVLSASSTQGEMARKRQDYFNANVELVWEIDPIARTVAVYTSPDESSTRTATDTLDGGTVLPGFILALQDLFAELDRHG